MISRYLPYFLIACASLLGAARLAAQLRVVGTVADSAGNGIAYANVALLAAADSSLVAYASTSGGGAFDLRLDTAAGSYLFRVTFVGYRSEERTLSVAPGDRLLDVGAVTLHPQGYLLGGVEVSGYRIPIRMRGDTVVFDADAFATGPHAVVEDLLRRLPGLSVEAGGVLRYHGRPISEVMVNRRPFFRGNTQLLTKNLNAAAVEDVEVYDRKSAAEIVSGQDDGRENLTVNLTIKPESEGEPFGEVYGGAGSAGRYRTGGKAFRINGTSQLGAVATANNLNETGLSYGDLMGLGLSGTDGLGSGGVSPIKASGQVLGDNRTLAGGLNYGAPFGKTANATLSYLAYDVAERGTALQLDRYADPARGSLLSDRTSTNRRYLHQVSADLEHQRDTTSWLTARVDTRWAGRRQERTAAVTWRRPKDSSAYTQTDASRQALPAVDASLQYSRRLGASGPTLGVSHRFRVGRDRETLTSEFGVGDPGIIPYGSGGDLAWATDAQKSSNRGDLDLRYRLGAAWTLTPSLGYAHERTQTSGAVGGDERLSTDFASAFTVLRPGFRLRRQLGEGHLSFGVERQFLDWRLTRDLDRSTRRAYWAPRLDLALEPGQGRLGFTLGAQPEVPKSHELLDLPDLSSVGQVRFGSPDLGPSFAYRLSGRYLLFNSFSGFNLVANAQGAHVLSPVGYALDLRGAVPVAQAMNFTFLRKQTGYLRVGQRIGPLQIKASVDGRIAREAGPGQLDGLATDYVNTTWQAGAQLERTLGKDGSVVLGYRYSRNTSAYGSDGTRVGARSRRWSLAAEVPTAARLRIGSTLSYQVFTAEVTQAPTRLPLCDLSIEWQVWRERPHGLRLSATDVLNQNRGVEQTAMGFLVRETRASVLGRVLLLEARWRL